MGEQIVVGTVLSRPALIGSGARSMALIRVRVDDTGAGAGRTVVAGAVRQLGVKASQLLRGGTRVILVLRAQGSAAIDPAECPPVEVERFAVVGRGADGTQSRSVQYPIGRESDRWDTCG